LGGILGTDLTGALSAGANITITPATDPGSRLTIATTGLQPLSSTLNALSTGTGPGFISQADAVTFNYRAIAGTANRITVSNGDGTGGNPTIDVGANVYTISSSNVLNDLASSTSTGIVVQSDSAGHHVYRTIQGTTGEIIVTNGSGISGNPVLSLDSSVYTDRDSSVLNALATGLTGTGFVSQNGAAFYDRTLTGTTDRVTITNPTGAAGDPVFDVGQDVLVVGDVTALPGIQIVNGTGVIQIGASGALGGTLTNITVGDIDPLWTTNVSNPTTTPTVSFVLNDMPSGAVLIGPQTGADAPGTLRRLLGDDLLSAIEAGSNITFSAVGDRIVISSTASGGGGGTVTEVFSGDLPPLFTTTVNNSTTVPDIQYILNSTASGNFLAGPASGSNGTWISRGILGTDLTGALQAGTNITISQSTPPNSRLIVALAGQIDASLIADGSVSNTEFQYLNGVTSGIQGQLDNKQPLDSTLTALAAFNSNGIMTQTAADTFTSRTVTGTAGNITITDGDGVSGNPTVNVGSNVYTRSDSSVLNALATGVNGTGFLAQNGASFADRTLTGTTNRITVTNGTGAAGNPVFDLGSDVLTISTSNVLNDLATSTSTGVVVQTDSVGHHAYRTLTGTANEVTVTNGDGVSGNPTFSLPTGIDVTKLANGSVDNTEFQYLDGVTSSIQTQLDGKLVSAGDLAPLFTTAEAAGNISFTLSNVASGTFLAGPASGGNGPWVNRGILGTDLTGAVQAGSNVTITQAPEPGSRLIISSTGSSGYNTIQEEGSDLTQRSTIDFVGAGITASDTGSKTQVALDATLNSLASYNTNGILTQTAADTFTGRTITGTGSNITVTDGNGVSGNPTLDVGSNVYTRSQSSVLNYLASASPAQGQIPMGQSDGSYILTKPNAGTGVQLDFANGVMTISATGAGTGGGGGYATIQEEGSNLTQRTTMNFIGAALTAADDAGNTRTNVSAHTSVNSIAVTPTNGQIPIGNGTNFTVVAPTAGQGIQITTGAGVLNFASSATNYGVCDGRLTLTSGVPVTSTNVTAATTIYFSPYKGSAIGLWNLAASGWRLHNFTERSIAVPSTTNTNYDVFITDALALQTVAWTNDTTRASNLATLDGVLVRHGQANWRYLGSFRTTGTTGQTEDSTSRRFVWNMYNRESRTLLAVDPTNSWTYSTASYREINGGSSDGVSRFSFILGQPTEVSATATYLSYSNSISLSSSAIAIGLDSSTAKSSDCINAFAAGQYNVNIGLMVTSTLAPNSSTYRGYPGIGYHNLRGLEWGSALSGTITWIGDDNSDGIVQTGLIGAMCA
jgi:hypothetical protein